MFILPKINICFNYFANFHFPFRYYRTRFPRYRYNRDCYCYYKSRNFLSKYYYYLYYYFLFFLNHCGSEGEWGGRTTGLRGKSCL